MKYPIVDVFAGPGGLGEGFASLDDGAGTPRFENIVSIERGPVLFQNSSSQTFPANVSGWWAAGRLLPVPQRRNHPGHELYDKVP